MAESIAATSTPTTSSTVEEHSITPRIPTSAASTDLQVVRETSNFAKPQSSRKRRCSSRSSPSSASQLLSPKAAVSSGSSPSFLTGAAAVADEQRAREEQARIEGGKTSPNPARKTLSDLLASQIRPMSRLQDAPSALNGISEALAEVAPSIQMTSGQGVDTLQTSPQSISSFSTLDNTPAATATTNGASVASPAPMDNDGAEEDELAHRDNRDHPRDRGVGPDEGRSNKALTFPGPLPGGQAHRTSSLPHAGYRRDSNRSPSAKRHKCPYCSTDFTRHHNLKSHLLTHSHEKPYSCDTCEARFRRLHDLKRHTKLHTGERPHVCPKCDRSFARGDALARHNKGQGGCAGRRSSMGSFGGDDRSDERMRAADGDSMPGIMYTDEASHEPENMDEDTDSPSAKSLPGIRKHDAPSDIRRQHEVEQPNVYQSRQPSTYPPIAARQIPSGGLYPPPSPSLRGSGSGVSTTQSSLNQFPPGSSAPSGFQASGPNVFSHSGITESPKPLSPAGMSSHQLGHADSGMHRNRSPSLTTQLHQQQFGRRPTAHSTSPSLPPPPTGLNHSAPLHLPPPQGLNPPPPDPRYTLQSQAVGVAHMHANGSGSFPGPTYGQTSPSFPPGNMSANNSLSSHSTGPRTSIDRSHHSYAQPNDRLWAYVEGLEAKINRLEEEVVSLKGQLNTTPQHR